MVRATCVGKNIYVGESPAVRPKPRISRGVLPKRRASFVAVFVEGEADSGEEVVNEVLPQLLAADALRRDNDGYE